MWIDINLFYIAAPITLGLIAYSIRLEHRLTQIETLIKSCIKKTD